MPRIGYKLPVYLWQSVNKVVVGRSHKTGIAVIARNAKVLCKVNNPYMLRNMMLPDKRLALAMTEAEEYNVDIIKWHVGGELHVCVSIETLVYVGNIVACVAFAVCENYLCLGVVYQEANKLASCIPRRTKDSNFYHSGNLILLACISKGTSRL